MYRTIFYLLLATALTWGQAKLIRQSDQSIEIRFDMQNPDIQKIVIDQQEYTRVSFTDARFDETPGKPMAGYYLMQVAVPDGAEITLSRRIIKERSLENSTLLPAIVVSGIRGNRQIARDETIFSGYAAYPQQIVSISKPYRYRRMTVVDLRIHPVQFLPSEKNIRLIEGLSITVNFRNGLRSGSPARFSAHEQDLHRANVINAEQGFKWSFESRAGLSRKQADYDLSIGNWYRIPVTTEGIYRVSGSFLADNGIDIGSIQLSQFQMFSYGGAPLPVAVSMSRPQDLNEVSIQVIDRDSDGTMDSNDEVLFYGRATVGYDYDDIRNAWKPYRNPYEKQNYYLVTWNQRNGKRISSVPSDASSGAVTPASFIDYYRFEDDRYNVMGSGTEWFWERLSGTSDQRTIAFTLPSSLVTGQHFINVKLVGGSGTFYTDPNDFRYTVSATLNSQTLFSNRNYANSFDSSESFNTSAVKAGSNTLQVNYSGNKEGCYMFVDYIDVEVLRPFAAENNQIKFYQRLNVNEATKFSITGFSSGTHRIWDISDFANINSIAPQANGSTVEFQVREDGVTARTYYTFADAAIRSAAGIEALPARPNLRDPNRRGQLLVIVADEFYDAAEGFEDFKETLVRGRLETERIHVSDIFREFSSTVRDPGAIRDFLRYAYNNWSINDPENAPAYVLIIGDGSYDYQNITLQDYINRVPVFEINGNNDINSRVTDNFFTAFGAAGVSTLRPDLPIGRLHANSVQDVENYIRKLQVYNESYEIEEAQNGWQSTITFVADDEFVGANNAGEWFHLRQTEGVVNTYLPGKFDVRKIYLTDYEGQAGGLGLLKPGATADLLDQINRGTLLINFFGHGDPNTWAHEQVFTKSRDLARITNGNRLPLWVAATCTWGKYDNPTIPSMSEEMIWSESGGIAVLAASRAVFAFQNELFVDRFFCNLFHNADDNQRSRRIGDAVVMAVGGGSNDQKYHIFGDPSLQLVDPSHRVNLTSFSSDTLKALSTVTLQAEVSDTNGSLLSSFNGKALVRVFDALDSLSANGDLIKYTQRGGTIFKGIVNVVNGQMEGSFIVPKSIKYKNSRTGRISIYAWSNDQYDAVGYTDTLLFNGTVAQGNDRVGPDISVSFPDQPDFFDGDFVGQQPTLVIRLQDESGINLTREVGHRIELTIDDNLRKDVTDFFLYDESSYTEGELRYTLPALAPGLHRLRISAWDNLNNISEEEFSFTTTSNSELMLARVVNYPNPIQDETQFTFQYQSPNGPGNVTIKIYTVSGRLIREIEDIARPGFNKINWDTLDEDRNTLANGVYLYRIIVDDGESRTERTEKLAIVR